MKRLLPLAFSFLAVLLTNPVLQAQQWVNYNSYNTSNGLSHNTVYDIAIDNSGNKWFACYYGVSMFNGSSWTKYTTANTSGGLAGNRVYCVTVDKAGNIWFGTDGGVSRLTGTTWTKYTTADGLANNEVHAIASDESGNMWFGTEGGVSKLAGTTWSTFKTTNGLVSNSVQSIAFENSNTVLFGCYGGASRFDGTNFTNYVETAGGLQGFSVNKAAVGPGGIMYFGTDKGVSVLNAGTWTYYSTANGLPGNDVRDIAIGPGKFWVGTTNGAGLLSGGTWTSYRTADGLASDEINAIELEDGVIVWFGLGMNGLSKLSPPQLGVSQNQVTIASEEASHAYFSVLANGNWTLTSNQAWLTSNINSANGYSPVTLTAAANPSTAERTAVVTITMPGLDPVMVTVTQQGAPAYLNLTPATMSLPSVNGSMGFAAVETNLSWTAVSNQPWCTVTPASGSGTVIFTVTLQANGSASSRNAVVTVSAPGVDSKTLTLTQEAAGAPSLAVSPSTLNLAAGASSGSVSVSSTVAWTASSDQGWLTPGTTSGPGNASVTLSATENTGATPRTAIVTFSGAGVSPVTVTVEQARSPYINVSVTDLDIDPAHNALFALRDFEVTSNTHWEISWSGGWFNLNRNQGDGNATVTITAEPNGESTARTGSIWFRLGNSSTPVVHTITLTQGAGPYLTVSPAALDIAGAAGSQGTFTINTNTNWTLAFAYGGMTADKMSGTGNSTVTITAPENNSGNLRKDFVAVMAATTSGLIKEVEINQTSLGTLLNVTPSTLTIGSAEASTATFSIVSNREWVVTTSVSWLESSVTSGSGNSAITLTADANLWDVTRDATVTVATDGGTVLRTITVTQDAALIILEVSATSINIPGDDNAQATFTVTSNVDWGISSNSFWLTVSPSGSNGTKTVTLTATGNYSGDPRAAKLTIWSPVASYNRFIDVSQSVITSVDDPDSDALSLYPNPASEILHVVADQEEICVTISDLRGRKVLTEKLAGTDKTLDVSRLARGVYLLSLELNGKTQILRFVKQ